jgi:hypothetical protein
VGLWVETNTHLQVEQFEIRGKSLPAHLDYLGIEALSGAGEPLGNWQERRSEEFHRGLGWISKRPQARVKWNVTGSRLILWSPRGPDFGEAEIRVDRKHVALIMLQAEKLSPSIPVWTSERLQGSLHAVVWQANKGLLPVDCIEVEE